MAYLGSTSTAPNVPLLVGQAISGPRSWQYKSTHNQAAVAATGFFTDGQTLGMLLRDSVSVLGSTTFLESVHVVNLVTSTGVTIGVGHLVSSAS